MFVVAASATGEGKPQAHKVEERIWKHGETTYCNRKIFTFSREAINQYRAD